MTAVLDTALELHAAGYSCIPIRPDGSKSPALPTWRQRMLDRADEHTIRAWFTDAQLYDLGVIQGRISGQAELTEIEGRAAHHIPALRDLAHNSGLGPLWDRITRGWVEMSPSGGFHFHYRVTGMDIPGNLKLAHAANREVLAETRGEGGQVVVAPSRHHATGRPWLRLSGSPATAPVITAEEREDFHALLRTLDETPTPDRAAPRRSTDPTPLRDDGRLKPGDDFEAKTTWADILEPHGWVVVYTQGRTTYWRRPGKSEGISATTGHADDRDRLYVFTSSTSFEQETPYTKFGAHALLNHAGDHSAAARDLGARGYGDKPQLAEVIEHTRHATIAEAVAAEPGEQVHPDDWAAQAAEDAHVALLQQPDEPAPATPVLAHVPSAAPVDPVEQRIDEETARLLIQKEARKRLEQIERDTAPAAPAWIDPTDHLNGTYDPPLPTVGTRLPDNGPPLLYAAAVNGFIGDPEAAKTLLATALAVDTLHQGGSVAWIDLDHNGAPATIARFRRFGATREHLANPARFRLGLPEDAQAADAIVADLVARPPTLVVLDSIGELLPLYGASSNDADEYTRVHQTVMARIATAGAAVLTIDHMAKGESSRAFGAGGTVAKKRAYDGALLRITVETSFAPGKGGQSELRIIKDRHGALRAATAASGREPVLARFVLEERENTATRWQLHLPGLGIGDAIADVDKLAEMVPEPSSVRDVRDRLGWGSDRASAALKSYRDLRAAGHV